jgi:23S rRNA (uridine2552-2'-O)-methyltransferase
VVCVRVFFLNLFKSYKDKYFSNGAQMTDKRENTGKNGNGARTKTVKLKTARGRTTSSQRWLRRQLNDPYVQEAQRLGYRSRSAFKLLQLDEKFKLLRKGQNVVDLGAAPGGWTQVATSKVLANKTGVVVGLDILPMDPVSGAILVQGDFMTDEGLGSLTAILNYGVDLVLSDMAASTTGHAPTDHIRTATLCEAAYDFSIGVLRENGGFLAKVFKGGSEHSLLERMKKDFKSVRHAKPAASRSESPETYVVAQGFRGK